MVPAVALRHVAVAFAAACTSSFLLTDCNPSLAWYDKLLRVTANTSNNNSNNSSISNNSYHDFIDKRVWIVGASSGIGREMAIQLAQSGAQHLILSSRSTSSLEAVAATCRRDNPKCRVQVLPLDVTNLQELKSAVAAVQDATLDIVVLNAGIGQLSPALETDPETANSILQTTALWPMLMTPLLFQSATSAVNNGNQRHLPHLVVTSSIAGKLAVPLSAVYAAAKFALQGYFWSLQAERPDLRIDLLCPGPVDTAFHQNDKGPCATTTNDTTDDTRGLPLALPPSSKLKMPVQRCVSLMLSAMQRPTARGSEVWIAQQPTLTALYIQQWFPGLQRLIMQAVGPKRVQLWREGLDLYDPASWKRRNASAVVAVESKTATKQSDD
jgi:dehydrogenase/reductase SDR family protein 7